MKFMLLPAIIILVAVTSCSRSASRQTPDTSLSRIENSDSLPEGVKKLVRAVADNDTASLAGIIMYPLDRPYPLHNIASTEEMEKYYPILVDDSLHKVISRSTPDQWSENGWRGWTLRDGQYLWLDSDSIYSINYISPREKNIMDSLSRKEIATLVPSLRRGQWKPVCCLKATDSQNIYRIDLNKKAAKSSAAYRLTRFNSPSAMRSEPSLTCTGYLELEGSAMIGTYHFTASDGTHITYTPDSPDGTPLTLDITGAGSPPRSIPVVGSYWLDMLPAPAK